MQWTSYTMKLYVLFGLIIAFQNVLFARQISDNEERMRIFQSLSQLEQTQVESPQNICYHSDLVQTFIRPEESIAYRYQITKLIAVRPHAVIVKAFDHCTGMLVALKVFPRVKDESIKQQLTRYDQSLYQDANFWYGLREFKYAAFATTLSQHCAGSLKSYLFVSNYAIVFPLFDGSLQNMIGMRWPNGQQDIATVQEVRDVAHQILQCLQPMHLGGVAHNDVKPDNILLRVGQNSARINFFALADFGLSHGDALDWPGEPWHRSTEEYEAPEVLLDRQGSIQSDMWSLGMTLFYLFSGKLLLKPYPTDIQRMIALPLITKDLNDQQFDEYQHTLQVRFKNDYSLPEEQFALIYEQVASDPFLQASIEEILDPTGKYLNDASFVQMVDFISKCLKLKPKDRLTAETALQHPFLTTSHSD
ncbi:hypothetical protein MIR68_007008 [Amoeboaphelidium protococcarum]|nr:hypothetical protein MIR68_007008 [Amoeboaphelidium protococcarum]